MNWLNEHIVLIYGIVVSLIFLISGIVVLFSKPKKNSHIVHINKTEYSRFVRETCLSEDGNEPLSPDSYEKTIDSGIELREKSKFNLRGILYDL